MSTEKTPQNEAVCCAAWAKMTSQACTPFGGGLLQPTPNPSAQFDPLPDGTWAIFGCCGGGCYVVTGMVFCPFCGADHGNQLSSSHWIFLKAFRFAVVGLGGNVQAYVRRFQGKEIIVNDGEGSLPKTGKAAFVYVEGECLGRGDSVLEVLRIADLTDEVWS